MKEKQFNIIRLTLFYHRVITIIIIMMGRSEKKTIFGFYQLYNKKLDELS